MKKLIAVSKDGKNQAVFMIPFKNKRIPKKREFLGDRVLNKVPMIGHKVVRLLTN